MNEENPQHPMDANMLVQGREYYVVRLDNNRQPHSLHDNRPLRFEEIRNGGNLIFLAPNGQEVVVDLNMINHDDGPFAIYHHTAAAIQGLMGGGANYDNQIHLNNQIPLNNQILQNQIPQIQIPHGGRRHRRHHKKHTRRHKSGRKHKKTRRH
jgi:hypothetical protein